MQTLGLRLSQTTFSALVILGLSFCLEACTAVPRASPATPTDTSAKPIAPAPTVPNLSKTFGLSDVSNPRDYFVPPDIEKATEHGTVYERVVTVLTWAGCDAQNRARAKVNFYNPSAADDAHRFLHDRPIWLPGRKGVVIFSQAGLAGELTPLAVQDIPAGVGLQFYLTEKGFAKLLNAASETFVAVSPRLYSLKDVPKYRAPLETPTTR